MGPSKVWSVKGVLTNFDPVSQDKFLNMFKPVLFYTKTF